ncbi:MAG: site-specific tyrosine recombinase XerD [Rikenellaceae bacterium]|nr:site-specific tyrosine recombinase XerD [Rikenellaceae bacterium]MCL2693244.1 site-specific tyrosine recombinase XerD [Rikenellaceae bacterium]
MYSRDWETQVKDYRSHLLFERGLARNSVEAYMRDVREFRKFIERNAGGLLPGEVNASHIEGYMSEVYDRGLQASSQARRLSGIRSFFSFLQATEIIDSSPAEFTAAPKVGRRLPDILSVVEIDAMLSAIDLSTEHGHRNRAMLEVLYSCGLRVSELVSLRLGDLFFGDGFVRVTGKGDRQRLVPLSDEARRQIELWLDRRRMMEVDAKSVDTVFLNRRGRKLSRISVFNIIREAASLAGIAKQVSPHTLRHSFATHLLEGGASIRQVQEMLGHESILTTEIYTHLDRSHLRRSIEKHHPLG